jgi:glycosyltransferase involved in cell wall biosynthesis
MKFSIIIVTFNRKRELENCLSTLLSQKIEVPFEIILVHNGETPYLDKLKGPFPEHKSFSISKNTPAHARNFALTKASGEYVFFLDDDCLVPENYFSQIDFNQDWDILGGPDRTPPNPSPMQKLIGMALASPFCMGPTFKRHSSNSKKVDTHADESELILCNLWFKRSIFSNEKHQFEESLFRNEENFLLKEMKLKNKKIFYDPHLFVYHLRKDNLEKLAKSIIKSGECRIQNYVKLPLKRELLYFTPLIFTLTFILFIFNPTTFLGPVFALYLAMTYLYGLIKFRTFHPGFLALHFFILFSYTIGLSEELLNLTLKKIRS